MRDMTKAEIESVFGKGQCPNCQHTEILPGPCGGAMRNVECANCGMRLNLPDDGWGFRYGQVLSVPPDYVAVPDEPDTRLDPVKPGLIQRLVAMATPWKARL